MARLGTGLGPTRQLCRGARQGLRRAVEQEGVNISFIKVKGHMDDHKGFIDKFRCAKGNRLADDYASKGMKEETTQMPYKMQELPLHISGETTTR